MFRDSIKKVIGENKKGEHEGNNKKKIENLVFFVVLLVVTLIIINTIWNGNKQTTKQENSISSKQLALQSNKTEATQEVEASNELESKLENILSKIEGVGKVNVCINYSESSEVIAMYNENSKVSTTEETDTSGGIRKIEENNVQKDIVYQENNGEKIPITKKVVEPKIEGAIITAKGANNLNTKSNIVQAVEALTGLATHKIQVFEMN